MIYIVVMGVLLKIFLCINKINVYIIDKKGNILLIFFSMLNECFIIKILIEKGVDINCVGENGWNVFYVLYVSFGMWKL